MTTRAHGCRMRTSSSATPTAFRPRAFRHTSSCRTASTSSRSRTRCACSGGRPKGERRREAATLSLVSAIATIAVAVPVATGFARIIRRTSLAPMPFGPDIPPVFAPPEALATNPVGPDRKRDQCDDQCKAEIAHLPSTARRPFNHCFCLSKDQHLAAARSALSYLSRYKNPIASSPIPTSERSGKSAGRS